jgi:hypothetical protein
MTKDAYFELCEMMGTEVVDSDIPIEFLDLPEFVQQCLEIYNFLPDRWEGMNGLFLGKDYNIVFNLFNIFNIIDNGDRTLTLRILAVIDGIRSKLYQQKQKDKPS